MRRDPEEYFLRPTELVRPDTVGADVSSPLGLLLVLIAMFLLREYDR